MYKNIASRVIISLYKPCNVNCCANTIRRRQICNGISLRSPRHTSKTGKLTSAAIASKYELITENNSPIIENTVDEIYRAPDQPILSDEFDGINLERGKNGVFEIKDLVELLNRENSKNVFVATVPEEINYVNYICIVSAQSKRHIQALAEFVRKVYKMKCYKTDSIPRIEGKDCDDWVALDLGNIALHIFSDKARKVYDLETLWAVGAEYDEQMKKKSEVVDIFENYSAYLKDLKPLS